MLASLDPSETLEVVMETAIMGPASTTTPFLITTVRPFCTSVTQPHDLLRHLCLGGQTECEARLLVSVSGTSNSGSSHSSSSRGGSISSPRGGSFTVEAGGSLEIFSTKNWLTSAASSASPNTPSREEGREPVVPLQG